MTLLSKLVFSGFSILYWISPLLIWSTSDLATLKKAETLFFENMYGDAIPLYSELLVSSQNTELMNDWALRLAKCHLEEEQPQAAISILSKTIQTEFSQKNQALFLLSKAYRQLGQSKQALDHLQQCKMNHTENGAGLILLEQSYHLMQMGDYEKAESFLTSIIFDPLHPRIYSLGQLQLAKIYFLKHHYEKSLEILNRLSVHPQKAMVIDSKFSLFDIERTALKGWAWMALQQEKKASLYLDRLLNTLYPDNPLSTAILKSAIINNLRQIIKAEAPKQIKKELFSKTEPLIKRLIQQSPAESSYLLLSDYYLIRAKALSDADSFTQAQKLLDHQEIFSSLEGLREVKLKQAAAAPSYERRDQLFAQLSNEDSHPSSFYARVWYFKGLNDLEEGFSKKHEKNEMFFERATVALTRSLQFNSSLNQTALTYKYLALAYLNLDLLHAWNHLFHLISDHSLMEAIDTPEELYCLSAWTALHINNKEFLKSAIDILHKNRAQSPVWQERYLKLEGLSWIQLAEWKQARLIFETLLKDEVYLSSHGEAWFWLGFSASKQQDEPLKKEYFYQAYTQHPQSPYAPIAYYHYYSHREYMHGSKKAIKHLQAMPTLFPNHPLLIQIHYLIGLYHKKDHISDEGQLIRRKDLTMAIDAFQLSESTFDSLVKQQTLSPSDTEYYARVRAQSQLERAKANLAIAKQSTGGKKQIYLEYAEKVFQQLINDQSNTAPYSKIWAEAELELAKVYGEKNDEQREEQMLDQSLKHYQQANMTTGSGVTRLWMMKGRLYEKKKDYQSALNSFIEAEKGSQGHISITPNEKLDIWIQQSHCYKELDKLDQSMKILSQVINEDVISPLRIKAMFLRAEIYELQGRSELAIKQLEATALKGGEWSLKAKEKLGKIYGY